jgi:hypothetical protein
MVVRRPTEFRLASMQVMIIPKTRQARVTSGFGLRKTLRKTGSTSDKYSWRLIFPHGSGNIYYTLRLN